MRVQHSTIDPPLVLPRVQSVPGCLAQFRQGIDDIESALAGARVMAGVTRDDLHCEMARSLNWLFDRIGSSGTGRVDLFRLDQNAIFARPPSVSHWDEVAFLRLGVEMIENILETNGRIGRADRARLQIEMSLRLRWLVGQAEIESGSAAFASIGAIWEALVTHAVEYESQRKAAKKKLVKQKKRLAQLETYERIQSITTSLDLPNTTGTIRAVPISFSEGVNVAATR